MIEPSGNLESLGRRKGCLATAAGLVALIVVAPPALVVRWWRARQRGSDVRSTLEEQPFPAAGGEVLRLFDLALDVPPPAEAGFRHRLTDVVVRVAEALRRPDDVYHLAYRLPWDSEPVVVPVGPQLQELGERFSMVLSQGPLAGRTVVWLTLGRGRPLAEVVDPVLYDPEAEGEPEALVARSGARWAMATEWARVGPSLVIRLILYVPDDAEGTVTTLLDGLR
ncbi:MAG: hypothetical protein KAJ97_11480 [Acidobacteria bacterium]|nr:hypothetical protein [Acidobacteriota bacterium]